MKKTVLIFILSIITLAACEDYFNDDYQEYYVVESYLVANRDLPKVRLSTTLPIDRFYEFEDVAVENAIVRVQLLDQTGSNIENVFLYRSDSAGIYIPIDNHIVQPSRTYRLQIDFPTSDHEITATAIVPDTFSVVSAVLDTLVYQSSEQLEITVSESSYPGRQNVFIFNTIAGQPVPENLTPVYFDFYDEEEENLEDFKNTSSGLLNEANFTVNLDGSVTLRYPWIAVAFYGPNKLVATTVDDNVYDLVRSETVQLGGSTLSPGEIQNVIYNIDGGIGIFGALASDTIETFIQRNFDF